MPDEELVRRDEERPSGRASPRDRARLALLTNDEPGDVLRVLLDGDPLGLHPLAQARIRARCLLLEPLRAYEEGAHHVVLLARTLTREEDLGAWLAPRMDEAIDNLLRRDGELLRDGHVPAEVLEESEAYLARHLDFEAPAAFRAAARFNLLSRSTRRAYVALFVERRSVAACLEAGMGPYDELSEQARLAVSTILSEVRVFRIAAGLDSASGGEHG